jgi:hypothetical protein
VAAAVIDRAEVVIDRAAAVALPIFPVDPTAEAAAAIFLVALVAECNAISNPDRIAEARSKVRPCDARTAKAIAVTQGNNSSNETYSAEFQTSNKGCSRHSGNSRFSEDRTRIKINSMHGSEIAILTTIASSIEILWTTDETIWIKVFVTARVFNSETPLVMMPIGEIESLTIIARI